jgi:uncharacterized protein involved in exopolysaccharide biosynthesis
MAPMVTLSRAGAIASLEAQVASITETRAALERGLLAQESELRALLAEDAEREAALTALQGEFAIESAELEQSLKQQRTELEGAIARERTALERNLAAARRDYDTLAPVQPGVALAVQIAPSGARVLAEAIVPIEPNGKRSPLIAMLAFLLAAFVGFAAALLREAVRDPQALPLPPSSPVG